MCLLVIQRYIKSIVCHIILVHNYVSYQDYLDCLNPIHGEVAV